MEERVREARGKQETWISRGPGVRQYFVDSYFSKKFVTKIVIALYIKIENKLPGYRYCIVDLHSTDIQTKLKDIDDYIK